MASNQTKLPVVIAAVAVAAMGAGAFLLLGRGSADSSPSVAHAPQAATTQVAVPPIAAPRPVEAVVPSPVSPSSASPDAANPSAPLVQRNRMTRDVKREQIWSALGREHELEPAAPGSAAPTEKAAAELPTLDPEYIRTAIVEQLLPVANECYESALADDPTLAGKLTTDFTIIGVEEVGGVVEDAAVSEDESTLDNAFVRECMHESLLAVTFEPPADGGRVEVKYSFEFAPDD